MRFSSSRLAISALVVGVAIGTSVEARLEPMGRLGDKASAVCAALADRSRRIHQPVRLFRLGRGRDLMVAKPFGGQAAVRSGGTSTGRADR